MNIFSDVIPIVLFFLAFKLWGIFVATAIAIALALTQITWAFVRRVPVSAMQWFTLGTIVVMGAFTLLFHDERIVKFKPTVIYGFMAISLLADLWFLKRDFLKGFMGLYFELSDAVWKQLSYYWVAFFLFMGALNVWVALTFDTSTWVNFKLFVTLGLTVAFSTVQAIIILRYRDAKLLECDDGETSPPVVGK